MNDYFEVFSIHFKLNQRVSIKYFRIHSCTQAAMVQHCGCADPNYPIPDGMHSCRVGNASERECLRNMSRILAEVISQDLLTLCNCHLPCEYIYRRD